MGRKKGKQETETRECDNMMKKTRKNKKIKKDENAIVCNKKMQNK